MQASAEQGGGDDRGKPEVGGGDGPQTIHEPLKQASVGVMVAVTDADSARVAPDPGRQKEKFQPGGGQRRMPERVHFGVFFAIEQHEPTVQVVSQHG